MHNDPWYQDGLRFQCVQCGSCCTGAPGYVWVNRAEIEALAAAIRLDVEEFRRRYVRKVGIRNSLIEFPNGDCVFFHPESRSCQVYQDRPRQCRTWPFWSSNLSTPAAWEEMCKRCPGGNRGRLVPLRNPCAARCLERVKECSPLSRRERGDLLSLRFPVVRRTRYPATRRRRGRLRLRLRL